MRRAAAPHGGEALGATQRAAPEATPVLDAALAQDLLTDEADGRVLRLDPA
jgi:hypothetical protein